MAGTHECIMPNGRPYWFGRAKTVEEDPRLAAYYGDRKFSPPETPAQHELSVCKQVVDIWQREFGIKLPDDIVNNPIGILVSDGSSSVDSPVNR